MTSKKLPVSQLFAWASTFQQRFRRRLANRLNLSESSLSEKIKNGHQFIDADLIIIGEEVEEMVKEVSSTKIINSIVC